MTSSQPRHPTLISIAPRFPAGEMEQALAFYAQLGLICAKLLSSGCNVDIHVG